MRCSAMPCTHPLTSLKTLIATEILGGSAGTSARGGALPGPGAEPHQGQAICRPGDICASAGNDEPAMAVQVASSICVIPSAIVTLY